MMEVLMVLGFTALILVPVLGWAAFAFSEQPRTNERIADVAATGPVRTLFGRDVASAASAATTGSDCTGGKATGGSVKLVLTSTAIPPSRVVYAEAPKVEQGIASATVKSLWRRTCDNSGALKSETQMIVGLGSPVTVTCAARDGVPSPDVCGQVRLETTTEDSAKPVSLNGARRWTGVSAAVALGGGKQAPVPVINHSQSDPNGFRNLVVSFDASGSSDPDGTIVGYFWDFGNGHTSTEVSPSETFTAVGIYSVSLTVTDNDGAPRTAYTSIEVKNRNPVAVIANSAGDLTGNKPFTVNFSSAGSNDDDDPGGAIASYKWSFGDGSTESTLANPTHTYQSAGTFTVVLTVTDNDQGTASDTRTVTVINLPPTIQSMGWTCQAGTTPCSSGADNSAVGTTAASLVTAFTSTAVDPDGGTVVAYEWSVSPSATIAAPTAQNTSVTFPTPGTYTVKVRAKDNDNDFSQWLTRTVKVNAPPTAVFTRSPATGNRPLTVSLDATNSADSDGSIASYNWSTTDGKTAVGVNPSLTWPATDLAGTRTITLTVTDSNGATKQTSQTITLVNRAPTAEVTTSPSPPSGPKPLNVNFSATGSNDPDGTPLTYQWKVDGVNVGGATSATYSRTFTTSTPVVVSVVVTDIDGSTATASTTVTPSNLAPTGSFTFPCHPTVPALYCTEGVTDSVLGTRGSDGKFSATFTGSGTDSDGTINAYEWSVSPTATVSNASAAATNITFPTSGSYIVSFRVRDNDLAWSPSVAKIVIVNAPPSVTATLPAGGRAPQNAKSFTSTITDPDPIVSTQWNFSGTSTFTVSGASTIQSFATPGTWSVTLTATDQYGGATTTSPQTFTVTGPPPPTISGSGPRCTGFLCLGGGYVDVTVTNKPPSVSKFQVEVTGYNSIWPCRNDGSWEVSASAGNPALRISTGCINAYSMDVHVRSYDNVVGVWGDWSPTVKMTTS